MFRWVYILPHLLIEAIAARRPRPVLESPGRDPSPQSARQLIRVACQSKPALARQATEDGMF